MRKINLIPIIVMACFGIGELGACEPDIHQQCIDGIEANFKDKLAADRQSVKDDETALAKANATVRRDIRNIIAENRAFRDNVAAAATAAASLITGCILATPPPYDIACILLVQAGLAATVDGLTQSHIVAHNQLEETETTDEDIRNTARDKLIADQDKLSGDLVEEMILEDACPTCPKEYPPK